MHSEGIPLEIVVGHINKLGFVPDWPDFIDEALRSGWKEGPLRTRIGTCCGDVYGPKHRDKVLELFDLHITRVHSSVD